MKAYDVILDDGMACPICRVNHLDDSPQYARCMRAAPKEYQDGLAQSVEETIALMEGTIKELWAELKTQYPGGLDYEVMALPPNMSDDFKLVPVTDLDKCHICAWEFKGISEMVANGYFPKVLLEEAQATDQIQMCINHYTGFRNFVEGSGDDSSGNNEYKDLNGAEHIAKLREVLANSDDIEGKEYKRGLIDRVEAVFLQQDKLLEKRGEIDAELYITRVKILEFRNEFEAMQRMRAKSRHG